MNPKTRLAILLLLLILQPFLWQEFRLSRLWWSGTWIRVERGQGTSPTGATWQVDTGYNFEDLWVKGPGESKVFWSANRDDFPVSCWIYQDKASAEPRFLCYQPISVYMSSCNMRKGVYLVENGACQPVVTNPLSKFLRDPLGVFGSDSFGRYSGYFSSPIYDAGRVVSWDRIQWTEDLPGGCDIELEVALADNYEDFENFVSPPAFFGPTGGGNFTTPAGESLPSGKTGRYAMVRATLTGNGTDTPSLSDIQLTCNAGSDTGSRVKRTRYDEAGNILKITTTDDMGTTEDVRDDVGWSAPDRINKLNQIMRQDVGGDTWTFSYDLNGNMTGKTNGVDTWIYTWDDENRLVRVQGPGSVDVAYSYDMAGRMLTRDDGAVTTFTWSGFDCIREITGMSTTTYCIPEGQLMSFIRDGDRYDVHCDALLSIRMVTDENGDVVLRREFDAWGGELAGNFDNVPGGMPYGFVGAAGCRKDPATGLVYMRARWYDVATQRFISRDPAGIDGGSNLYKYADNSPTNYIDLTGREPVAPPRSGTTPVVSPAQTTTVTNNGNSEGNTSSNWGARLSRLGLYAQGAYDLWRIGQGYLDMEEGKRQGRDATIDAEVARIRQWAQDERKKREEKLKKPDLDGPGCDPPVNCDEVHKECRKKCVKIFIGDPEELPGSGRNYQPRLQRCVNSCMTDNGC